MVDTTLLSRCFFFLDKASLYFAPETLNKCNKMEEKSIKFEDMPNAITGVLKKLSVLENKIDGLYDIVQSEKEETWFTVAELRAYLPTHPVEHTIYCWTSNREIPFHKRGKRIMFLKSEIDDWLQENKSKSRTEIRREAEIYVQSTHKNSVY